MKVAITGHTKGIGKEIHNYFLSKGYECLLFSRTNGYDIGMEEDRTRIINESKDCDIFVNNACVYKNDSQLHLLEGVYNQWTKLEKIIINISSRVADDIERAPKNPVYAELKYKQDVYCNSKKNWPWVINMKPGMIDTDLTKVRNGIKMKTEHVTRILDFVLTNGSDFKIRSVTFSPE